MNNATGIYRIAMLSALGASALGRGCLAAWAKVKPPKDLPPPIEADPPPRLAAAAPAQTNYGSSQKKRNIDMDSVC